jgi:heme A synthase
MARDADGPGPVAAVHRILIATALVGALAFVVWALREYDRTGATGALVVGGLGLMAAAGIGLYLRSLRGLAAKLTPRRDDDRAGGGPR